MRGQFVEAISRAPSEAKVLVGSLAFAVMMIGVAAPMIAVATPVVPADRDLVRIPVHHALHPFVLGIPGVFASDPPDDPIIPTPVKTITITPVSAVRLGDTDATKAQPKQNKKSEIEPAALLAYAKADIGKSGPQLGLPASLWCADFINRVMKRAGLPGTGSRMARDFARNRNFVKVSKPVPGDIVVVARGRGRLYGHVALYSGKCGKGIRMLGGNQRGRRVTNDCVGGRNVVAFVRPKDLAS